MNLVWWYICKYIFGHQTSFHLFRNTIKRLSDVGINTWQIPILCFVASEYKKSLKWVPVCCYIILLLPAEDQRYILTDKFCYSLFKLTSKCKRPECDSVGCNYPTCACSGLFLEVFETEPSAIWVGATWTVHIFPINTGQLGGFRQHGFCKHLHTDHSQIIMLI